MSRNDLYKQYNDVAVSYGMDFEEYASMYYNCSKDKVWDQLYEEARYCVSEIAFVGAFAEKYNITIETDDSYDWESDFCEMEECELKFMILREKVYDYIVDKWN